MEIVSLEPTKDSVAGSGGMHAGEDGVQYPYRWYTLLHPSVGFDPHKNAQAKLKVTIQVCRLYVLLLKQKSIAKFSFDIYSCEYVVFVLYYDEL